MAEQHGERRTFNFLLFENCPCIRFHPLVVFRGTLFLLRISLLQWHGRRWCHMLTWSLEQSFWQEGRCIIGIAFSMDEVARYDSARVDRDRNQVRIRESVGLRIEKKTQISISLNLFNANTEVSLTQNSSSNQKTKSMIGITYNWLISRSPISSSQFVSPRENWPRIHCPRVGNDPIAQCTYFRQQLPPIENDSIATSTAPDSDEPPNSFAMENENFA